MNAKLIAVLLMCIVAANAIRLAPQKKKAPPPIPTGGVWKQYEPNGASPSPRIFPSAAINGNNFYLNGGLTGPLANDSSAELWQYALFHDKWTQLSPSPNPLFMHTMVDFGDYLLVFGGQEFSSGLMNYTYSTDTWSFVNAHNQPPPRTGQAAVRLPNGQMWIFGGRGASGVLNDVWTFNPATSSWKNQNPSGTAPSGRLHIRATLIDSDKIVLYGGADLDGNVFDDFWMYSISQNQWIQINATGDLPGPLAGYVECFHFGGFVIFGGFNGTDVTNDVYLYDQASNTWHLLNPDDNVRPAARAGGRAARFEFGLLVFGGGVVSSDWDAGNILYGDLWLFEPDN